MAEAKKSNAKSQRGAIRKAKRNAQNKRTFLNVQKRRNKHAKAHPDQPHPNDYARRWVGAPSAA